MLGGLGVQLVIYLVLFVLDPLRLYLGYSGNLLERVSSLFAFWILTLLFALPGSIYLLLTDTTAVQFGLNVPLFIFFLGTYIEQKKTKNKKMKKKKKKEKRPRGGRTNA